MKGYDLRFFRELGHFDSYKSIGTELMLTIVRKKGRIVQVDVPTKPRDGEARIGGNLKANYIIGRAAALALQEARAAAAVFLLSDQPFISPALIRALCRAAASTSAPILAPFIAGQRANPVFIRARLFPLLAALTGDQGARALFEEFPPAAVAWHDPQVRVAIDTPEDYRRWCPEGQAEPTSAAG
jgi:CTP:molybdopterin cytidylyltransferase MocA